MKKTSSGIDVLDVEAAQREQQQHQRAAWAPSAAPRPDRSSIGASRAAAVSGLIYSVCSAALTLLNKKVLVHYDFHAVHSLLAVHCLLAVGLVRAAAAAGWADVEPPTWEIVRLWTPVNAVFVAMLATNFYALRLVGVGMVSVLKNAANVFILAGDWLLFGRSYSWHVWLCLGLMAVSMAAAGATDANYSAAGYGWQMANNVFTAAYALCLSRVTERAAAAAAPHGGGGGGAAPHRPPLSQWSMVYYNNLLSLPLLGAAALLCGELRGFWGQSGLYQPSFQALALLSGVCGFGLSFSSICFVSLTTATFYSLVGSFNKVIVAGIGIVWFRESTSWRNLASIGAGLLAGTLLPLVKMRSSGGASGYRQLPQHHHHRGGEPDHHRHHHAGLLSPADKQRSPAATATAVVQPQGQLRVVTHQPLDKS